ncbi:hypothetical protein B6K86_01870 [Lachnospiraceae bacterium]|nr:hypothetical protein B6K86_01870 [Lachnospiraceae bacterium]
MDSLRGRSRAAPEGRSRAAPEDRSRAALEGEKPGSAGGTHEIGTAGSPRHRAARGKQKETLPLRRAAEALNTCGHSRVSGL